MSSSTSVIGRVVAQIALQRLLLPADHAGGRPAVRIINFSEEEVVAIANELDTLNGAWTSAPITIKVGTRRHIPGLPDRLCLAAGETPTYWRNADVQALAFLELDSQGDEEGLATTLHRLDDASVLSDGSAGSAEAGSHLIAKAAWDAVGLPGQPLQTLLTTLETVRISLSKEDAVSLRRWTDFTLGVCEDLKKLTLVTPDEVDRAVGDQLHRLRLFPDRRLFSDDKTIQTRLTKNRRVAQLRQPTGVPISEEDLLDRIATAEIDPTLLTEFTHLDDRAIRKEMQLIVQGGARSTKQTVQLQLWLALFERKTTLGLGAQIRQALESSARDRVPEFDDLDVEAGLDEGEQPSAETLLLAEPPSSLVPLVDVLPKTLRRRVERLAFPDSRVEPDPLRALLYALTVLEDAEERTARLETETAQKGGDWSQWLFAFLYGATLRDVCARSESAVRTLEIQSSLLEPTLPELPEDDDDFDFSHHWAPIRLVLSQAGSAPRRFRWDPQAATGLVALAALIHEGAATGARDSSSGLETWCDSFLDPRAWTSLRMEAAPGGHFESELGDLRTMHFDRLRNGLSTMVLQEYVDAWTTLAEEVRSRLVPSNSPVPDLAEFVLTDVLGLPGKRLALLATHPLRLRWVAAHFRRMADHLSAALDGRLALNPENSELFFDWLQRASPHGLPPFVVGEDEEAAVSTRETAWHEEYAVLQTGATDDRGWSTSVDDAAIDEMVEVMNSYLLAYPYKADGLVALLLQQDGSPRLPLRLVQRLRQRSPGVRIELYLATPRSAHHEIVRAFDDAFLEDETPEDRLFPDVQLVLVDWRMGEPPPQGLEDRVDIALAPALFGTRTSLQLQTRTPSAVLSGSHDPWLLPSTHDLGEESQNVTRILLPRNQDLMLETWSTLCLRHYAHSPVSPQSPENTDYFALQVRFDRHQALFAALHKIAHWVVTLDTFIGRDQIDAMEDRPEVILVRGGVGKNEAYTLLVSSATGRRFVVRRLARKLRSDLALGPDYDPERLAERVYEVGRNVVPGSVLRALGLGSAAQEVLGLVVSRFAVAEYLPFDERVEGLEIWLSFDEHLDWFSRTQRMRADLGRFVFSVDETGQVSLSLLVVESKYRQVEDLGVALQQLGRTTDLCRGAFERSDSPRADSEFWWQELARAIEQTSRIPYPASELPARRIFGPSTSLTEDVVLDAIRAGNVRLDSVEGLAVAIAAGNSTESSRQVEPRGEFHVVRLHRPELMRILDALAAGQPPGSGSRAPQPSATSVDSQPVPIAQTPDRRGPGDSSTPSPDSSKPRRVTVSSSDGLGAEAMRERYERVLDVLRQHNVQVVADPVQAWAEGPGFYVLRVVPKTGVTVDKVVNRVNEIQLALRLPSGMHIRASLDRGSIRFEVPKTPDERYAVLTSLLWPRCPVRGDSLVIPLGEDISGDPVELNMSSPDSPHLLVAGTTGSGKSVALETILRGICRYPVGRAELHLVDPKGTELVDFEGAAHTVGDIGIDAIDARELLDASVAEMQKRYEAFRSVRVRDLVAYNAEAASLGHDVLPWRVLVLDEYADLTSDPNDKSAIEQSLRRLTQKARAAGIHVIVATQRPSADVISTTIRSNLPAQLALRVKTMTDSRIVMDEGGAEALAGQGDALLKTARGVQRLQIALTDSVRT